jgi:hypothetical protein
LDVGDETVVVAEGVVVVVGMEDTGGTAAFVVVVVVVGMEDTDDAVGFVEMGVGGRVQGWKWQRVGG